VHVTHTHDCYLCNAVQAMQQHQESHMCSLSHLAAFPAASITIVIIIAVRVCCWCCVALHTGCA
jgi:hypothetical protein